LQQVGEAEDIPTIIQAADATADVFTATLEGDAVVNADDLREQWQGLEVLHGIVGLTSSYDDSTVTTWRQRTDTVTEVIGLSSVRDDHLPAQNRRVWGGAAGGGPPDHRLTQPRRTQHEAFSGRFDGGHGMHRRSLTPLASTRPRRPAQVALSTRPPAARPTVQPQERSMRPPKEPVRLPATSAIGWCQAMTSAAMPMDVRAPLTARAK
jgi:hypothetical protein